MIRCNLLHWHLSRPNDMHSFCLLFILLKLFCIRYSVCRSIQNANTQLNVNATFSGTYALLMISQFHIPMFDTKNFSTKHMHDIQLAVSCKLLSVRKTATRISVYSIVIISVNWHKCDCDSLSRTIIIIITHFHVWIRVSLPLPVARFHCSFYFQLVPFWILFKIHKSACVPCSLPYSTRNIS